MNDKETFGIFLASVLCVFGIGIGAYQCGAANTRNNIGAERRATEVSRVHTELGNEQRANTERLSGVRQLASEAGANIGELETEQRANTERLNRIYSLTTEANTALGELRKSGGRSGGLLSLLEREVDILEDYIDSMWRELTDYRGNTDTGGTTTEVGEK